MGLSRTFRNIVLIGMLILAACGSSDPATISGSWERTGGDFSELQGMVVEVAGATGTITSVDDNAFGFVVGDEKWQSITENSEGTFTFDDLLRDTAGGESTVPGIISIAEDGNSLQVDFPTTGTTQTWTRVP